MDAHLERSIENAQWGGTGLPTNYETSVRFLAFRISLRTNIFVLNH